MITYLAQYSLKGTDKRLDLKPAHLEYLTQQYESGKLLAAGIFVDKVGGYLLFKADSLEEVVEIIENDPYIINGARSYQVDGWDMSPFPLRLK